jgi:steroid delta-isomerase
MNEARIRQQVAAYFAAINALDADAWVATFAPDGESHDPVGAPPHVGPAGLRGFFLAIAGGFQRLAFDTPVVYVSGNGAAVPWKAQGVTKSGRTVRFEGVDVFELDERGLIRRLYAYWDPAPLMAVLAAEAASQPARS